LTQKTFPFCCAKRRAQVGTANLKMPPRAIVCHICGGKYFKSSFPIHLKQCEKKWKKTHSECAKCGAMVGKADWSDHLRHCKKTLSKRERAAVSKAPPKSMLTNRMGNLTKEQAAELIEAASLPELFPQVDGRISCKICGRKFNSDRIDKHTRICFEREQNKRKRKTWNSHKRRVEGTDFEQYSGKNRPKTPPEIALWKKHGRRWKEEVQKFRAIIHADDPNYVSQPLDKVEPLNKIEIAKIKKATAQVSARGKERLSTRGREITEEDIIPLHLPKACQPDPFRTKPNVQNSPREENPFQTKANVCNSPREEISVQAKIQNSPREEISVQAKIQNSPREENPFQTKAKVSNSPPVAKLTRKKSEKPKGKSKKDAGERVPRKARLKKPVKKPETENVKDEFEEVDYSQIEDPFARKTVSQGQNFQAPKPNRRPQPKSKVSSRRLRNSRSRDSSTASKANPRNPASREKQSLQKRNVQRNHNERGNANDLGLTGTTSRLSKRDSKDKLSVAREERIKQRQARMKERSARISARSEQKKPAPNRTRQSRKKAVSQVKSEKTERKRKPSIPRQRKGRNAQGKKQTSTKEEIKSIKMVEDPAEKMRRLNALLSKRNTSAPPPPKKETTNRKRKIVDTGKSILSDSANITRTSVTPTYGQNRQNSVPLQENFVPKTLQAIPNGKKLTMEEYRLREKMRRENRRHGYVNEISEQAKSETPARRHRPQQKSDYDCENVPPAAERSHRPRKLDRNHRWEPQSVGKREPKVNETDKEALRSRRAQYFERMLGN